METKEMTDDTISRAAARMCLTGDITAMNIEQYIKMVDKRLEQLPPSPTPSRPAEPQWIPCSERLPDSKEYVLVTEYGETNMGRRFCGKWWLDYCGDKMKDVTAWMPLPEPYKGDEINAKLD